MGRIYNLSIRNNNIGGGMVCQVGGPKSHAYDGAQLMVNSVIVSMHAMLYTDNITH